MTSPFPTPLDPATRGNWGPTLLEALEHAYRRKARLTSWPIYAYGASYSALNQPFHTAGEHWLELLADDAEAGAVTSYAVGARRAVDVVCTLVNGTGLTGVTGVIAAGEWPSTTARSGLVVLDPLGNDIGHYPAMNVAVPVPAVITSANTRYLDGLKGMYRAMLALASSESRIEQTAATFTGTWTATALASPPHSGGSVAYTSTVGAKASFPVPAAQIPQHGPLAGKVYFLTSKLDASLGTMATINVQVDAGAVVPVTVNTWEQYTGHNGLAVSGIFDCIPVDVPIDGADHTVSFTHAGSAGHFMYADAVLCPSTDPNPILFMGWDNPPVVRAGFFDAAGVTAWKYNIPKVQAVAKAVVAEFPNAVWVPSTLTASGLWSGDGIHPNDRGMQQRAGDALNALQGVKARLDSRALALTADGAFGIV